LEDGWSFKNISLLQNGKVAVVLEKEFSKPEDERRFVVGVDVGSSTLATATVFDTETSKIVKQLSYVDSDLISFLSHSFLFFPP